MIERSDFPISFRGFQREQVARHLKEIADLVERQEPPELRLTNGLRRIVNSLQEVVASSAAEIRAVHQEASAEAKQALDSATADAQRLRTAAEEEASRIRSEAEVAAERIRSNADRYVQLRWSELREAKERLMRSTEQASWFFDAAGHDFGQMKDCLTTVDDSPSSAEELERRVENGLPGLAHRSHEFGDKLRSRARPGAETNGNGNGNGGVRAVTRQVD